MADTKGLLKTRNEWMEAVTSGETDLPHSDWYEKQAKPDTSEKGYTATPMKKVK